MEPPTEPPKSRTGRKMSACSQCKRRKQRCDRQWPCTNCQRRMSGHLCQYEELHSPPDPGVEQQPPRKRKLDRYKEPNAVSNIGGLQHNPIDGQSAIPKTNNAVRSLGYAEEAKMFPALNMVSDLSEPVSQCPIEIPSFVQDAVFVIPPRPYTDALVRNFFENVNYHYEILHQVSFMTSYVEWWAQRRQFQKSPSINNLVFACLILRICANSTQFLLPDLQETLETELSDSAAGLSSRYQAAARQISDFVPPGKDGLAQVQQLFLGATWLKAEAEFTASWHTLAEAVREAQELDMHLEESTRKTSELEKELRNRMWCALFVWDVFMTAMFGRPSIIPARAIVSLPDPRLDESPGTPIEIPPPIVERVFQAQLAKQLISNADPELTSAVRSVESWIVSLPPVFKIQNPVTRWDQEYPRLVFQRLHLHVTAYMTLLMSLRPYLMAVGKDSSASDEDAQRVIEPGQFVDYAIDIALSLMATCKEFFDLCLPNKSKYFMVSFCPFDTAALLCSVLLHDRHGILSPRRPEILRAIGCAQYIARSLCENTKMGTTTSGILLALVSRLELSSEEKKVLHTASVGDDLVSLRTGVNTPKQMAASRDLPDHLPEDNSATDPFITPTLLDNTNSDGSLSITNAEWTPTQATDIEVPELDLGVLDGMWDWEGLGLEVL